LLVGAAGVPVRLRAWVVGSAVVDPGARPSRVAGEAASTCSHRQQSSSWRRRRWEAELCTDLSMPSTQPRVVKRGGAMGDDRFSSWVGTSGRMRQLRQNLTPRKRGVLVRISQLWEYRGCPSSSSSRQLHRCRQLPQPRAQD